MPYEATVPVHRRLLWPAVIDPERLLSALPNAVIDASGNQGVAGRLRVRMRDQTVTFRGIARIIEVIPKSLRVTLEVEATFGRAGGAIEGVVEITLRAAGSGTRAVVGGSLRLADGSSPLPPDDAVDAALGRIVRRWFTALAESSPAAPRAELPQTPPAAVKPPRTKERAPLAVVRDVPSADPDAADAAAVPDAGVAEEVDEQGTDKPNGTDAVEPASERPVSERPVSENLASENSVSGSTDSEDARAEEGNSEGGSAAEDADSENGDIGAHGSPSADAVYVEAASDEDSASENGFEPGGSRRAEPAAARAAGSQVQLRLVSSRESVAPEEEEPDVPGAGSSAPWGAAPRRGEEPERPAPAAEFEPVSDEGEDAGEDIWSRLRDRGMPRWIPVVLSAVLAACGTTVLFVTALRRRHRRHED